MVTLYRGYLPTFLTDFLMLTCSPYRWHTIPLFMYLAHHFCALPPLRSCSIFIYSCSCSACTLYMRLCHLIVIFRGEKKDQPIHPFFPQHLSCSSQYSPQVSMAFMLLPSVSFRGSLIIPLGFGLFVRSARTVQEAKQNHHNIWSLPAKHWSEIDVLARNVKDIVTCTLECGSYCLQDHCSWRQCIEEDSDFFAHLFCIILIPWQSLVLIIISYSLQ